MRYDQQRLSLNAPYTILRGSATGGGTLSITNNDVLLNPARGFIVGPQGGSVFVGSNLTFTVNSALVGNHPLVKNGPGRFTLANGNVVAGFDQPARRCDVRQRRGNCVSAQPTRWGAGGRTRGIVIVQGGATLEVGPTITTGNSQNVFLANGATLAGFGNCKPEISIKSRPLGQRSTVTHQLLNAGDAFTVNNFNGTTPRSAKRQRFPEYGDQSERRKRAHLCGHSGGGKEGLRGMPTAGIIQNAEVSATTTAAELPLRQPGRDTGAEFRHQYAGRAERRHAGHDGRQPQSPDQRTAPARPVSTANIPMLTVARPQRSPSTTWWHPGTRAQL